MPQSLSLGRWGGQRHRARAADRGRPHQGAGRHHVNVFVNGNKLASPLVSSLGTINVNRNTGKGQSVPTIKTGSIVRVRTLGGTLIASGTF